jgi:hypothetical protein
MNQQAALLTLSIDTDQLSRITLPPNGSDVSTFLLAARLNAIQPGAALAAWRKSDNCVQILCAKVSIAQRRCSSNPASALSKPVVAPLLPLRR